MLLYKGLIYISQDAFNGINCLYNGTKEWKMIEYKYENKIYKSWEPEYEIGGYSLLDVQSVDLIKYPEVQNVPWSFVTVNAGDCLFLPKSKLFNVTVNFYLRRAIRKASLNVKLCQIMGGGGGKRISFFNFLL